VNDYTEQVRAYLVYCRRASMQLTARGSALDPKYHPTENGACRLIPHRGDPAEARAIRQAFRNLTEAEAPSRTEGRAA
jgi:hypothetical protein